MRNPILPKIAAYTIDCGYVQAAHRRVKETHLNKPDDPEPPTVLELEDALGERVQNCTLWKSNWRNRIYRVELASGVAVAKQLITGSNAKLQCEFDQLEVLARLQVSGLHVPKPLALLLAKRVLVMEFVHGSTISAMLWNHRKAGEAIEACQLAGKILARIHMAWTHNICPMPVELLAGDLAAASWRLSSRQEKLLQSTFKLLAGAKVSIGQIYCDYKPANLLFDDGGLYLIDAPGVLRRGVQLWDFSCFRSCLRRELWRLRLARPLGRRVAVLRQSLDAFKRGYVGNLNWPLPEPALFALAARIFDLQRNAVLISVHKGKIDRAHQKIPIAREGYVGNSLANRSTLPLLEMEKRWLFRQLARELPRC